MKPFWWTQTMFERVKTLWQLMLGQRLRYGAAIAAILIGTSVMYLRPLICRGAIDHIVDDKVLEAPQFVHDMVSWLGGRSVLAENLWIAGMAVVLVTAVSGVFGFLRGRWSAQASESIARQLKDRLYQRLQDLPCTFHDSAETGDLVQRCTSDVETIRRFLAVHVVEIGRAVILMGTAIPILLYLDVRMAMLSVVTIPLIVGFSVIFFVKVKILFTRVEEAEGKMTSLLQENLTGVRVVRAFARQDFEREKFAGGNADYRNRGRRLISVLGWYWPISDFVCMSQAGLVVIAGAYFVTRGELTIGTLYACVRYVGMYLWPVRHMGRVLADLGRALVSLERVEGILSQAPESDDPSAERCVPHSSITGAISIQDLSFHHGSDNHVLTDVSFEVSPGQTLAILGPSGSGKSTLINLLLRLYDYQTGSIRLDGVELKDLPRRYVRSQIGAVLQEPFLYSRTLRENIKLGRFSAADEEMVEAASSACLHESVLAFDNGYDTIVGERGVTLSGGQRQRVALARALLKDPPILILDDALSAVDTRTEAMILEAMMSRYGRRTTLVIAHRLTTLMRAEKIIVLDKGRVVQSGTHQSLLEEEGTYRRLWHIQNSLDSELQSDIRAAGTN